MLVKGIVEVSDFQMFQIICTGIISIRKRSILEKFLACLCFSGPLTYNDQGREVVVGVVSWGYRCALATYPGVYSRVTAVLPWINEQMLQAC